MRIEEYLKTLPENLLSGEDVQLPEKSLREIFEFAGLDKDDVFYHLGCGDGSGVRLAVKEFDVKRAVGIDNNAAKIKEAEKKIVKNRTDLFCRDIRESEISDASVILFWFTDEGVICDMMEKFEALKPRTKIITIWGPLTGCLPEKVAFPYIINQTPFKKAKDMQEQLLAVFGVRCVDFVTAWEFAERYTKSVGTDVKNDRFLTIIQTLIIWINARKLGVACRGEIPESIRTYVSIMKMHFGIDFGHLLEE